LLEVFPTRTRLTGAALGYNAGYAIFGGTAPLVASLLVESTESQYAPGWYLAGVAVLVLVASWSVPETKENDIHA
jgi:MHS family proline/betaine transporter-like MFS transporter